MPRQSIEQTQQPPKRVPKSKRPKRQCSQKQLENLRAGREKGFRKMMEKMGYKLPEDNN